MLGEQNSDGFSTSTAPDAQHQAAPSVDVASNKPSWDGMTRDQLDRILVADNFSNEYKVHSGGIQSDSNDNRPGEEVKTPITSKDSRVDFISDMSRLMGEREAARIQDALRSGEPLFDNSILEALKSFPVEVRDEIITALAVKSAKSKLTGMMEALDRVDLGMNRQSFNLAANISFDEGKVSEIRQKLEEAEVVSKATEGPENAAPEPPTNPPSPSEGTSS